MKKAFILTGCGMLILWCITAALLYCGMFQDNPSDFGYGLFGLLCGAEGLASGMSLVFYWMSKRNRFVTAVYVLSTVLAVLVVISGMFWLLYAVGIQILPPPQR